MQKYNGLLSAVSSRYHILQGEQETENQWKTRLIYSICGMMACASLRDDAEEPVSIVHVKKRIRGMLANYRSMYPELAGSLPSVSGQLEDEIADLFSGAGVVYHRPGRITSSMKREEPFGNILFQRGIALDSISCVSGIGFYTDTESSGETNPAGIKAMFGLEQENLRTLWRTTISGASWVSASLPESGTEYLRMHPPFSRGYWVNRPDTTGSVSILRTGMKGAQLYCLYRCTGTAMEVSPLPQWQVEAYNYRASACACLSSCGSLPPVTFSRDGALVHIRLNYLLPPRELNFLKLFSWPETCTSLPCDFKRKLSAEVFTAVKTVLTDEGYEFEEGMI